MYINPKIAIREGWVTGIRNEDLQVQPNAIDFTLDKLYGMNNAPFFIGEEGKKMRGGAERLPLNCWNGAEHRDYWIVKEKEVVDGMSDMYVEIPSGVAAHLIIRSTFNRNGLFLTSGLYDSGFKGHIGFALHNRSNASAFIEPGTRVGQIYFVESDSEGTYGGRWNHDKTNYYLEDGNYPDRAGGVLHAENAYHDRMGGQFDPQEIEDETLKLMGR